KARYKPHGMEQEIQRLLDGASHHIGREQRWNGEPLGAEDGDTESRLLKHEHIVGAVANGGDAGGSELTNKMTLLRGVWLFVSQSLGVNAKLLCNRMQRAKGVSR